MKIYNEIVYQIIDDKLVKESEDSFEYSGEISECKNAGKTIKDTVDKTFIPNALDATSTTVSSGIETLTKGPGGELKGITNTIRDWSQKLSHHAFGSTYPGHGGAEEDDPITYEGGEDDAMAELEAQRRQQNKMRGRGAANQTQGQSATLLTS